MRFFKFGQKPKKGYLGVDVGASGIKVVQLNAAGSKNQLFTYGLAERGVEEAPLTPLEQSEEVAALLKEVCAKARATTTAAVAALPIPAVFSSVVSIASADKKELKNAAEREAKKLLPRPLEEMTLDFKELPRLKDKPEKDDGAKTVEVLLTAAPKEVIEKYRILMENAGLVLAAMETEAFSLIRALLGIDPTPTAIVDIGSSRSNILIVDRGVPILTRSVEVGGRNCTEKIAAALQIPPLRAEEMKRDLRAASRAGGGAAKMAASCEPVFEPLVNELKYSFDIYKSNNAASRPIERMVLTGGGANLAGLTEFLTQKFNIRTYIGNPWEQIKYHDDLKPLLQTLGSRLTVATGLALRPLLG